MTSDEKSTEGKVKDHYFLGYGGRPPRGGGEPEQSERGNKRKNSEEETVPFERGGGGGENARSTSWKGKNGGEQRKVTGSSLRNSKLVK